MLDFISTPFDFIASIAIVAFGLYICFFQFRFFRVPVLFAIIYFCWHTLFSVFYYVYSLDNAADAKGYYLSALDWDGDLSPGTGAVTAITHVLTTVGLSYGNSFLFFSLFGFVGMLALAGALRSVANQGGRYLVLFASVIVMVPGLSFWSGAVGKDALTFMGAGLVSWAALSPAKRYPALLIAALAFIIARPHIAGIFLVSLAISSVIFSKASSSRKAVLMVLLVPVTAAAVIFAVQYVGLGSANDAGDLGDYLERRQSLNTEGGSSIDIASMSIPMRLFSYLFRPMPIFDGAGLSGLVLAFENLIFLAMLLFSIRNILLGRVRLPRVALVFCGLFVLTSWLVLANTTANLGIAVRQKWMFLPMLMVLMIAAIGYRRSIAGLRRRFRPARIPTRPHKFR